MKVNVYRPAPAMSQLQREVGRLFNELLSAEPQPERGWMPRADVVEFPDRFEVLLDLPGVAKDNLAIEVEDDVLKISGEREKEGSGVRTYSRCECSTGPFSRAFPFPTPIQSEKITARLENGVLRVVAPKAEQARPRNITVE